MISAGISSSLFAILPYWYKLPLKPQQYTNRLAICSSIYHIYDNQRKVTESKNTTMLKIVECLDGMAIILCCGNYWLPEKRVSGLIHMYTIMKMVSNNELIKHSVYFSTVIVGIRDTPLLIIPWVTGATGLLNYFKYGQN